MLNVQCAARLDSPMCPAGGAVVLSLLLEATEELKTKHRLSPSLQVNLQHTRLYSISIALANAANLSPPVICALTKAVFYG